MTHFESNLSSLILCYFIAFSGGLFCAYFIFFPDIIYQTFRYWFDLVCGNENRFHWKWDSMQRTRNYSIYILEAFYTLSSYRVCMKYAVRSTHCVLQSHMFVLQQRWTMHLFKILGINSMHSCDIALAYIGIIVEKAAIQLEFTKNMKIHMKPFAFIFIEDTKQGIPCINIRCLSDIFSSAIS